MRVNASLSRFRVKARATREPVAERKFVGDKQVELRVSDLFGNLAPLSPYRLQPIRPLDKPNPHRKPSKSEQLGREDSRFPLTCNSRN